MTVAADSGRNTEHTIGLIACSRHQSGSYMPWATHRPKLELEVAPGDATFDYLRRNLGYESSRWSRLQTWNPLDSEQFTGHTALMVREQGVVTWARGWVPQFSIKNYVQSLLMGGASPGEWQDDQGMIADPTCISYEVDVPATLAGGLRSYWQQVSGEFQQYSFSVLSDRQCNCVWAAVGVLKEFARIHTILLPGGQVRLDACLAKVTEPTQGKFMSLIASGQLLQP